MSKPKRHNFHVPLSTEVYQQLRAQAEHLQQPATVLAREAITAWLETRRRSELAEELAAYAKAEAGSEFDLDEALEAAGIETLKTTT